jgi:hypothetical protein
MGEAVETTSPISPLPDVSYVPEGAYEVPPEGRCELERTFAGVQGTLVHGNEQARSRGGSSKWSRRTEGGIFPMPILHHTYTPKGVCAVRVRFRREVSHQFFLIRGSGSSDRSSTERTRTYSRSLRGGKTKEGRIILRRTFLGLRSGDLRSMIGRFPVHIFLNCIPRDADHSDRDLGVSIDHISCSRRNMVREGSRSHGFVLPSTCVSQCRGIGGPLLL